MPHGLQRSGPLLLPTQEGNLFKCVRDDCSRLPVSLTRRNGRQKGSQLCSTGSAGLRPVSSPGVSPVLSHLPYENETAGVDAGALRMIPRCRSAIGYKYGEKVLRDACCQDCQGQFPGRH